MPKILLAVLFNTTVFHFPPGIVKNLFCLPYLLSCRYNITVG